MYDWIIMNNKKSQAIFNKTLVRHWLCTSIVHPLHHAPTSGFNHNGIYEMQPIMSMLMMKITIPNVLIVHMSKDTSAGDLECQEFKIFPHGFTTRMSLNILRVSETFGNKMTHISTQWLNNV